MTAKTHVMLAKLRASDVPPTGYLKVVRERDLEGFDVKRLPSRGPHRYLVENATTWADGWPAHDLRQVRAAISAAP